MQLELRRQALLSSSLLGYKPIQTLLGPHGAQQRARFERPLPDRPKILPLVDRRPFSDGLGIAFAFAIGACLIAAPASTLWGGKYVHTEPAVPAAGEAPAVRTAANGAPDDAESRPAAHGALGIGQFEPARRRLK